MAAPTLTVVDATDVVPRAGALTVTLTIQQDSAAMDLSAKTVVATVRREDDPDTVIDTSLEDHALVANDAVNGVMDLVLTHAEMQLLTAPADRTEVREYLVDVKVVEDNYHPQMYRLHVREVSD
jgi:D-arabinose 5-phosphate isomerase GutQ